MTDLLAALGGQRVLPILRATDPDAIVQIAGVLVAHGLPIVEVTMSSADPIGDVRRVRARHPAAVVGMGTVTSVAAVADLVEVGVAFVVTPVSEPSVIAACREVGLPVIAGALTPTEVFAAHQSGATAVKIFPAGRLGPAYLADVLSVLPRVPLVPTGGIRDDEVPAYLDHGALAVGLGSSLTGTALTGDRAAQEALPDRVAALVHTLQPREGQTREGSSA